MEHTPVIVTFSPELVHEVKAAFDREMGSADPDRTGADFAAAARGVGAGLAVGATLREIARDVVGTTDRGDVLAADLERALQELAAEQAAAKPGMLVTARNPTASMLQSLIAEQPPAAAKVRSIGTPKSPAKEIKFDHGDLFGWAGTLFHMLVNKNPAAWRTAPAAPEPVGNTLRIAVAADWGTGLYGAPAIARTIASETFDIIMHLGDVYYSGTEKEVRSRFLDLWPNNANARRLGLNGNHEMYSGGHGYFNDVLSAFGQGASYFALMNDHWVLVGLDTAYEDNDLANEQAAWLRDIAGTAGARKIVLFSHHQPFSRFETQGKDIVKKLEEAGRLLTSGRIFAWYHGHEHLCAVYDRHPTWNLFDRCVGHGGMPYKRMSKLQPAATPHAENGAVWLAADAARKGEAPASLIWDAPNPFIDDPDYGANGFLTLEIEGQHLVEVLHAADGTEVYRRALA